MKIQGPNLSQIQAYKNQSTNQKLNHKKTLQKEDHVNISQTAKKLQESQKGSMDRTTYVNEIKQAVQSGEYKINHEATAKKMIDFWSKR